MSDNIYLMSTRKIDVHLGEDLRKRLDERAAAVGVGSSTYVRRLIERDLQPSDELDVDVAITGTLIVEEPGDPDGGFDNGPGGQQTHYEPPPEVSPYCRECGLHEEDGHMPSCSRAI